MEGDDKRTESGGNSRKVSPPPGTVPVTMEEACKILDLTDHPVKARIREGVIYGHKVREKGGLRWRIWLPAEDVDRVLAAAPRTEGELLVAPAREEAPERHDDFRAAYEELLMRHETASALLGAQMMLAGRLPALEANVAEAKEEERRSRELLAEREAAVQRLTAKIRLLAITAALLGAALVVALAALLLVPGRTPG